MNTLEHAIQKFIDKICEDYNKQTHDKPHYHQAFRNAIRVTSLTKYYRIELLGSGAHSFIVRTNDVEGFKCGDILKAARFREPAKNYSRGNVLEPDSYFNVSWKGY